MIKDGLENLIRYMRCTSKRTRRLHTDSKVYDEGKLTTIDVCWSVHWQISFAAGDCGLKPVLHNPTCVEHDERAVRFALLSSCLVYFEKLWKCSIRKQ